MKIQEILEQAVRQSASDILIIAGMPAAYKINGLIQRQGERLLPNDIEALTRELYQLAGGRNMDRLLEKGEAGRAYNVGSDVAVSILELAQLVKRVLNSNSEIVVRERATPGRLPSRYVPSIERAGRELGLRVEIPLEEAICRSVRKDA